MMPGAAIAVKPCSVGWAESKQRSCGRPHPRKICPAGAASVFHSSRFTMRAPDCAQVDRLLLCRVHLKSWWLRVLPCIQVQMLELLLQIRAPLQHSTCTPPADPPQELMRRPALLLQIRAPLQLPWLASRVLLLLQIQALPFGCWNVARVCSLKVSVLWTACPWLVWNAAGDGFDVLRRLPLRVSGALFMCGRWAVCLRRAWQGPL
mmetsp:Transcript_44565/g.81537  ORF Transcript_44565/g.81537 Transcript_44565/m.81537 type:complete len:206 (-) Transcript_44565:80-697(-)